MPWPSLEPGTPSTPDIAFPDARRSRHAMLSETEKPADTQGQQVESEEQEAASEEKQLAEDEKEDAEAAQTQTQEQQPEAAEPAPEVCMHTRVRYMGISCFALWG